MEMNNDIFTPDLPIPRTCWILRMHLSLPPLKKKSPSRLPRPAADAKRMPRC